MHIVEEKSCTERGMKKLEPTPTNLHSFAPPRTYALLFSTLCSPNPLKVYPFECAHGHQFFPLSRGVEKIVGVNRHRHTVIFDTRTTAIRAGPDVRHT